MLSERYIRSVHLQNTVVANEQHFWSIPNIMIINFAAGKYQKVCMYVTFGWCWNELSKEKNDNNKPLSIF